MRWWPRHIDPFHVNASQQVLDRLDEAIKNLEDVRDDLREQRSDDDQD